MNLPHFYRCLKTYIQMSGFMLVYAFSQDTKGLSIHTTTHYTSTQVCLHWYFTFSNTAPNRPVLLTAVWWQDEANSCTFNTFLCTATESSKTGQERSDWLQLSKNSVVNLILSLETSEWAVIMSYSIFVLFFNGQ